ncbi:Niemann-Pick C1-like protein 1 [Platysternon megacephalum]|uniref:Niemann-Pick C1-like protein 1 n=1 Tax=Platysternon megacephalum TaxID=55544 RepID=A0A4D9DM15_9SAUR|nr:Niemann-Pick C1-like protein 1 [Platysternon megacephalum]
MKQLALLLLLISVTRATPCAESVGAAELKLAIRDLLENWEDTSCSQSYQSYQSLPRSCKEIKATRAGAGGLLSLVKPVNDIPQWAKLHKPCYRHCFCVGDWY